MGVLNRTNWKIVTTEEISGSIFASASFGKLYLEDESTHEKMTIKYRTIGFGLGKGPPVGAAWSDKENPSGGFENVGVTPGHSFGWWSFPVRGYMIGVGISAGVVGSALGMDLTGGGVTAVLFGMLPVFAGVRIWGMGKGACPGVGATVALALFEQES
jgi:hypothetical protein